MDVLTRILYTLSAALLVPVVVLLLALVVLVVVYLGGFLWELWQRRRWQPRLRACIAELKHAPEKRIAPEQLPALGGLPAVALREATGDRDKTLDDLQLLAERLLARLNLAVRLGPVLGLAGTLIPLGPALVALAEGDIATLSARLVVAFTTTVLGLLVGGLAFAMHLTRRHWYMQDLNDVEFLFHRLENHSCGE